MDSKDQEFLNIPQYVSEGEAAILCKSGEWIDDIQVNNLIQNQSLDIAINLSDIPPLDHRLLNRCLMEFFSLSPMVLAESEGIESKHYCNGDSRICFARSMDFAFTNQTGNCHTGFGSGC